MIYRENPRKHFTVSFLLLAVSMAP